MDYPLMLFIFDLWFGRRYAARLLCFSWISPRFAICQKDQQQSLIFHKMLLCLLSKIYGLT